VKVGRWGPDPGTEWWQAGCHLRRKEARTHGRRNERQVRHEGRAYLPDGARALPDWGLCPVLSKCRATPAEVAYLQYATVLYCT